jgi:HK97 gp10 family phage protein
MSSDNFKVNATELEKLEAAMKAYQGDVETTINDVLHNYGGNLIQESVRQFIPESGKTWKGKASSAKAGNSLRSVNENLAVTVTTTKKYQYLYFPDDGTSTKRHAGNQQFFEKGGEAVKDEIIERCISKLTNNFEQGV